MINNEIKFDFVSEARKALIDVGLISRVVNNQQTLYILEKGKFDLFHSFKIFLRIYQIRL